MVKKVEMTEAKIPISMCRHKGENDQGAFLDTPSVSPTAILPA
jgi:hypothetical protein